MKRPAAKDSLAKAKAKAKVKSTAKSKAKGKTKDEEKHVKLRVLYMSGAELLELRAPKRWTVSDLEKKVKEQMAHLKCDGSLKKLVSPQGELKSGKSLAKLGLLDGTELHAVLRQPDESSGDSWMDDFDDYSDTDDDLYLMDHIRPARCEADRCIHDGCPNKGCDYYGGECRHCFDEH